MQENVFIGSEEDISAIRAIIGEAYIQGIHIDLDETTVRKGFHPGFTMNVLQDGTINPVSISQWIAKMEEIRENTPGFSEIKTDYNVSMVNVTGNAASVRIDVYKDERHTFTDYMLLYKIEGDWKIVSKIFHRH